MRICAGRRLCCCILPTQWLCWAYHRVATYIRSISSHLYERVSVSGRRRCKQMCGECKFCNILKNRDAPVCYPFAIFSCPPPYRSHSHLQDTAEWLVIAKEMRPPPRRCLFDAALPPNGNLCLPFSPCACN